jgi:hypothetical protein
MSEHARLQIVIMAVCPREQLEQLLREGAA